MNLLKALRFGTLNRSLLDALYKREGVWYISYEDFCRLDKWTKLDLGEQGVLVLK